MFLGHFAVALAAKKAVPSVSLGTWCAASQALDILWPVFLLAGVEHVKVDPGNTAVTPLDFQHYPWSHSLLMSVVWAVLFGAGHFAFKKNLKAAGLLAAVVLSHWVLDFITHRPDLPLWPGGPLVGLGLWNHRIPAVLVEVVAFAAGIFLYESSTKALDKVGSRSLFLFALVLLVTYIGNVFGPPPPDDPKALASVGFAMWILFAWAFWFDRHRVAKAQGSAA